MDLFGLLQSWMALLIPQPCFDEYFTKYNFFDGKSSSFMYEYRLFVSYYISKLFLRVTKLDSCIIAHLGLQFNK